MPSELAGLWVPTKAPPPDLPLVASVPRSFHVGTDVANVTDIIVNLTSVMLVLPTGGQGEVLLSRPWPLSTKPRGTAASEYK